MKISKEKFDAVIAFVDRCSALLSKFIDAKLVFSLLLVLSLAVGVGTLYLKNIILEQCLIPDIQEKLK